MLEIFTLFILPVVAFVTGLILGKIPKEKAPQNIGGAKVRTKWEEF
jgi:hypothetical protein